VLFGFSLFLRGFVALFSVFSGWVWVFGFSSVGGWFFGGCSGFLVGWGRVGSGVVVPFLVVGFLFFWVFSFF